MTIEDAKVKIQRLMTHAALLKLWGAVRNGETESDGWAPGLAFQYLILRGFEIERADVRYEYKVNLNRTESGDGEALEKIDGAVHDGFMTCLVECKDWHKPAPIEPIAKLRNQLLRRPETTFGSVFSSEGFTDSAIRLAEFMAPQVVLLWNREDVDTALRKKVFREGLLRKYRHAAETGWPDLSLKEAFDT